MPESHKKRIAKKGSLEVVKKILKMIPIIGPVFSVGFAGHDIKKKGLIPGAVHVALDVTPVVGTAKNVVEIFTGDWIPDKARPSTLAQEPTNQPLKQDSESPHEPRN
jgi:hypothetical protein